MDIVSSPLKIVLDPVLLYKPLFWFIQVIFFPENIRTKRVLFQTCGKEFADRLIYVRHVAAVHGEFYSRIDAR